MRSLIVALPVVGILATANSAKADRRVAFVVGNGDYKNVQQLPNSPIAAKSMADLLQSIGFELVEGIDLTRDKMNERLREFGKKAEGADVAVFFYAGHGIAVDGAEYLLPVDADIKSEMDVKLGSTINFDVIIEQIMNDAKITLVFLDASRNDPFARKARSSTSARSVSIQARLAEMKSGEGALVAFATGPGQTALDGQQGTNRPFTRALIANIAVPGLEVQRAITRARNQVIKETNNRQFPWAHSNLLGALSLNSVVSPPDSHSGPNR